MLRNRLFLAVSVGHLFVDVLNSIGPVLLAALALPLGLSNARIALALSLYTFAGALSQPFFGLLADSVQRRAVALAGLGLLWMLVCYVCVALAPSWELLLACLLLAALGSGLFHPIGTASAAAAAGRKAAGSATALFFFFGQAGLALGPVLAGVLLQWGGAPALIPICLVALLPALLLITTPAPAAASTKRGEGERYQAVLLAVVAFVVLVALRSSIQATYQAFLPKLFSDRGWNAALYGLLLGVFMLAAAIGNLVTGIAADRYGMRAATVWPLLLSVPSGLICLWAPSLPVAFVASALAGLFICGQHSVLVLHAQRLLPTRQGFASGLILGFTFATGGVGTWIAGSTADIPAIGLLTTMQVMTLLALPCALFALSLPGRTTLAPQHAPIPAATSKIG